MNPVYFADMRTSPKKNLLIKARRLLQATGFLDRIQPGDLVAIKLHWGETGNLAFIPPPFIGAMVEEIKKVGAKPFLTDTNTLYRGARRNAVDNIHTAITNGFSYSSVSAPVIVADGLWGHDYHAVAIPDGERLKEAKIASAIHRADALLVVSHLKGHALMGFGGTLKNLGMGCAAPAGKQALHSDISPEVNPETCKGCQICLEHCPVQAISLSETKAVINQETCYGCGECVAFCPHGAIPINWNTDTLAIQEKTAEYAWAATHPKGEKVAYLNFVINVSPDCDCASWNDSPIVADQGILASNDPVAIDQAGLDLVNQAPVLPGTALDPKTEGDRFAALHHVDPTGILEHAQKLGMGSRKYTLETRG